MCPWRKHRTRTRLIEGGESEGIKVRVGGREGRELRIMGVRREGIVLEKGEEGERGKSGNSKAHRE